MAGKKIKPLRIKLGLLTVLLMILCSSLAAHEVLFVETGMRYWDPIQTYNGYTLFATRGISYLIDMEGNVVHSWPMGKNPRLLDYNGHFIDYNSNKQKDTHLIKEMDWDGNTVWQFSEERGDYHPHHDFVRIYNKKLGAYSTLYIANKDLSTEECIQAGYDPAQGAVKEPQMDAIVEVDMAGNVIWEWWFFDHLIQDFDPEKDNYAGTGKTIADYPGRLNINIPGRPIKRDWLHCNSIAYSEELGQIVINSVNGEFYVIDHQGTFVTGNPADSVSLASGPKGDFLYRFGDPARYGQGDPPSIKTDWTKSTTGHKQIGGSHNAHWIDQGLPGEGHLLVFNNGQYLFERTSQSYIFEINPFLANKENNSGRYINPPDAGYYKWDTKDQKNTHKQTKLISNQVVWIYAAKSNQAFFSHIGSSAQRLPNGNTLICSMTDGHIFEVTAEGEAVWEFINPVTKDGILSVIPDTYPMHNQVFRAYRYGADHPALQGQDLKPGKPMVPKQGIQKLK
jgi:hypothetical protein